MNRRKNMKKKTIAIVSILLGILLIGIVSAGLIDYFGRITGEVTVEDPVFYLSKTSTSVNDLDYYSLNLNQFDENVGDGEFTNGLESEWFITEELGIEDFYPAKYTFYVKACAENNTETDLIGQIDMTLKIIDSNGNPRDINCPTSITDVPTVNSCSSSDYQEYLPVFCSIESLNLNPTDRFLLSFTNGAHQITYYIKMDGYSRIETTYNG